MNSWSDSENISTLNGIFHKVLILKIFQSLMEISIKFDSESILTLNGIFHKVLILKIFQPLMEFSIKF